VRYFTHINKHFHRLNMGTLRLSQAIKFSCPKYFQHAEAKIRFVFGGLGRKDVFRWV
jgi:hypothetical protein